MSGFSEECLSSQWFDVEQSHSKLDIVFNRNSFFLFNFNLYLFKGDITSLLCSLSECLFSCIKTKTINNRRERSINT